MKQLTHCFIVRTDAGFHSRPVARFIKILDEFPDVSVSVECKGRRVDGKSFLDVLSLCASLNDELSITLYGEASIELMDKIIPFFHNV